MLDIYINPYYERLKSPDFNVTALNFTWDVVSFDGDTLKIQLNFNDPFYISIGEIYDELVVNFYDY